MKLFVKWTGTSGEKTRSYPWKEIPQEVFVVILACALDRKYDDILDFWVTEE
jgi:hypothetical protein